MNTNSNSNYEKKSTLIDYLVPPLSHPQKKTLVLDLDETLVHSQFQPFSVPSDVTLEIELEGETHEIHVLIRPGVQEFLENMSKLYEIIIFTASVSKYAAPLLDILDPKKFCNFRLYREHCTSINSCFVKELRRLGRDLKNIIIVDNSPMSYALNPENGLPIPTWFDDKSDRELYNLSSVLEFLSFVPDVREYITKFVVDDCINYENVIEVFDKYNEMLNMHKKILSKDNKNTNNNKVITKKKCSSKAKNINNNNENNKNINNEKKENKDNIDNIDNKENKENKENISINININPNLSNNKKNIKIISKKKSAQKDNKSINNKQNIPNTNTNTLTENNLKPKKNFDPSSIIASVPNPNTNSKNILTVSNQIQNIPKNIIKNTTKSKSKKTLVTVNNVNSYKILINDVKHKKADSVNTLNLPKKLDGTTKINNHVNLNSKSIILNNSYSFGNNINFGTLAHSTKNKDCHTSNFQLSMRINHDNISIKTSNKLTKKINKNNTNEKISKKKIVLDTVTNPNTENMNFTQKIKTTANTTTSTIVCCHKRHKSINTTFIPFPNSNLNTNNNENINSNNKNININVNIANHSSHSKKNISKNSVNTKAISNYNTNKILHRRITSTNLEKTINNQRNGFLTGVSGKSAKNKSQRKINPPVINMNCFGTNRNLLNNGNKLYQNDQIKNNYDSNFQIHIKKKIVNKIPYKKKIFKKEKDKDALKMSIEETLTKNVNPFEYHHKKTLSCNQGSIGAFSVRPKSTKQIASKRYDKYTTPTIKYGAKFLPQGEKAEGVQTADSVNFNIEVSESNNIMAKKRDLSKSFRHGN